MVSLGIQGWDMSEGFAIDSHDEVKRLLAIAKRHLGNIGKSR
jgi:hypothetical protein